MVSPDVWSLLDDRSLKSILASHFVWVTHMCLEAVGSERDKLSFCTVQTGSQDALSKSMDFRARDTGNQVIVAKVENLRTSMREIIEAQESTLRSTSSLTCHVLERNIDVWESNTMDSHPTQRG